MKEKAKVLVIDDDPMVARSCRRVLEETCRVTVCETGRLGLEKLAEESFDLALVDLMLPDIGGLEILDRAPDKFPDLPIVIITGYSTIQTAVEAIKRGAFDYISKPFTPEEIEAAVEKALRQRRFVDDYRRLQEAVHDRYRVYRLLGESPPMKRVFSLIEQVAQTDSTVLILGESGTGKDLVARAVHFSGPRKDHRFVAVDCGAVAPSLIASELFGCVKGAFTGATEDRVGLIQAADGGALFLDEVDNLPVDCQTSLLRAIEDREVRPVGAAEGEKVDARFIAASNTDLGRLVQEGRFRQDLYYRLNVFPIHLPPLRNRREDIPLLARHFLEVFGARMHKRLEGFTQEALNALQQHDWPGNVRELSNVIERIVIVTSGGRVGEAHLREGMASPAALSSVPETSDELNAARRRLRDRAVMEVERLFLVEALRRNEYNITRVAERTGMQRTNFQAMLRKHNLRVRDLAAHRE